MFVGDAHCVGGVGGIEVGADFLGQPFGALVDAAAAHDLQTRQRVHFAHVVDHLPHGRHALGQRGEEHEQVGAIFAQQLEDLIIRNPRAGEADIPPI